MSENAIRTKYLLFDIEISGHHQDYIIYLANYFKDKKEANKELLIVSSQDLFDQNSDIFDSKAISFYRVDDSKIQEIKEANLLNRSILEWKVYLEVVKKFKPTHSILLYFDTFLLGINLIPKKLSKTSAILFRPTFHYPSSKASIAKKISLGLKKILLRRIYRKGIISNLFVLDSTAIPTLKETTGSPDIIHCPDPVKAFKLDSEYINAFQKQRGLIIPDRKTFLIFGFLDERKGIEPFLKSLGSLSPAEHAKIHLIIAGPIEDSYKEKICQLISELPSEILISTFFEEIKGEDIQCFFELADFIVAIYQRHVGMSSILVRAAISKKPVISDQFGYMAQLVAKNKMGLVINSENNKEVSAAVKKALNNEIKINKQALANFALENSESNYCQVIFKALD